METNPYQAPAAELTEQAPIPEYPRAGQGKRFLNYIIDRFMIYGLVFVGMFAVGFLSAILGIGEDDTGYAVATNLIFFGTPIFYYVLMEATIGRTIGKLLTKTLVLNLHNQKPSFGQILGRSFSRYIPFDAFTFLGSYASGWHDTIPKTKVVDTSNPPLTPTNPAWRSALDPAKGVPLKRVASLPLED